MTILALDLSSKTGWATRLKSGALLSGVQRIGSPGCSVGEFGAKFNEWLVDALRAHQPRTVVFEAPLITSHKTSLDTARKLLGLAFVTETICHISGIWDCQEIDNQTLKKFFTGSGHASKEDMVLEATRRGWRPIDHNEADAQALLAYAEHCKGIRPDSGEIFRQARAQ